MNNLSFCFLAYGDEHIKEFNHISKLLLTFGDIFVCTDNRSKIIENVNITETSESFNYNLKRKSIEQALKKFDTILVMDTDYHLIDENINFSVFNDLLDGLYITWIDDKVDFMGEKISTCDINNKYFTKLDKLNISNNKLFFIDECVFLLKISDKNKKIKFIENWNYIFNETKDIQPNNGNNGAIEGLIIYLSCLLSNINIYKVSDYKSLDKLFNNFYHYSKEMNKNFYNTKKTLI